MKDIFKNIGQHHFYISQMPSIRVNELLYKKGFFILRPL